jgi:hypothetical protein
MSDIVDFRVSDTVAIGHDDLNVIIFVASRGATERSKCVWWDGQGWRARYFVYRSRAALLTFLRELGCVDPDNDPHLAVMPEDLGVWCTEVGSSARKVGTATDSPPSRGGRRTSSSVGTVRHRPA